MCFLSRQTLFCLPPEIICFIKGSDSRHCKGTAEMYAFPFGNVYTCIWNVCSSLYN